LGHPVEVCVVDVRRLILAFRVHISSSETESSGGDTTYDLVTIAAVNSSISQLLDGVTITKINFWIHAILIKMLPCLLLTLFGCLLVSTVRASQQRALRLRSCSRIGPNLSKASSRRLKERNRTTVITTMTILMQFFVSCYYRSVSIIQLINFRRDSVNMNSMIRRDSNGCRE